MTADGDGSSRAAAWAGVCPLVSLNRRESEGLDADAGGGWHRRSWGERVSRLGREGAGTAGSRKAMIGSLADARPVESRAGRHRAVVPEAGGCPDAVGTFRGPERADPFTAATAQKPKHGAEVFQKDFWVYWTLRAVFGLSYPRLCHGRGATQR